MTMTFRFEENRPWWRGDGVPGLLRAGHTGSVSKGMPFLK